MKILYEDRAVVVCVKEPGLISEAGGEDSLITLLNRQFSERGEACSAYPIHRLDRNVGGVMVYAKTKAAAAKLSAAVQRQELKKEYLAAVHGVPAPDRGRLDDLLWKDVRKNKTYVVDRVRKGVKDAALDYRVVSRTENRALVHIQLHTGRSHQIRVQFASRKWPLVGDGKYGARDHEPLALYSCSLTFPHPCSGEVLRFASVPDCLGGFPCSAELI